jgi:zinc-ribbon domain
MTTPTALPRLSSRRASSLKATRSCLFLARSERRITLRSSDIRTPRRCRSIIRRETIKRRHTMDDAVKAHGEEYGRKWPKTRPVAEQGFLCPLRQDRSRSPIGHQRGARVIVSSELMDDHEAIRVPELRAAALFREHALRGLVAQVFAGPRDGAGASAMRGSHWPTRAARTYCPSAAHNVCNWLVSANSPEQLCVSCRHNRIIPDLSQSEHVECWRLIEIAKHRSFFLDGYSKSQMAKLERLHNRRVADLEEEEK